MAKVAIWVFALAFGLATLAPSSALASPKPKIEWARVEVPSGESAARLTRVLKEALKRASRRADFGKAAKTVTLSARMTELSTEKRGDVLQVSCTITGRVLGGAAARSRISYGGSPERRQDLEKEVVTMVANGLVLRLAQIARTQPVKARAVRTPPG